MGSFLTLLVNSYSSLTTMSESSVVACMDTLLTCCLVVVLPHQVPRVAQLTRTELVLGEEQDGQHHAKRTHDDVRDAEERVPTTEP